MNDFALDRLLMHPRPCRVQTGGGQVCGRPAVARVLGTDVCGEHEDSTRDAADVLAGYLRGPS
jgi:hypothetical protein